MAIKVVEIHHYSVRFDEKRASLADIGRFYNDVLGLRSDVGRPDIPGVPGLWIDVGEVGQIHIVGGEMPSRYAQPSGIDPTAAHVAFGVEDVAQARDALDQQGASYWQVDLGGGPGTGSLYLNDPCGNLIELHQIDTCRCVRRSRL